MKTDIKTAIALGVLCVVLPDAAIIYLFFGDGPAVAFIIASVWNLGVAVVFLLLSILMHATVGCWRRRDP